MDAVGEPTLAVPVVTESVITQTSTEKSDNYAVPADDVQHLVRTEESAGATLRLPKVRGKGNVLCVTGCRLEVCLLLFCW